MVAKSAARTADSSVVAWAAARVVRSGDSRAAHLAERMAATKVAPLADTKAALSAENLANWKVVLWAGD